MLGEVLTLAVLKVENLVNQRRPMTRSWDSNGDQRFHAHECQRIRYRVARAPRDRRHVRLLHRLATGCQEAVGWGRYSRAALGRRDGARSADEETGLSDAAMPAPGQRA